MKKTLDAEQFRREKLEKEITDERARMEKNNKSEAESVVLKTFDLLRDSESKLKEAKDTITELELAKQLLESEVQSVKKELQKTKVDHTTALNNLEAANSKAVAAQNALLKAEAEHKAEKKKSQPEEGQSEAKLAILKDRMEKLSQLLKEYSADMELQTGKLNEFTERHKESQKKGSTIAQNSLENEFRAKSEELLLYKDRIAVMEEYWSQIERVLQGKPAKAQLTQVNTSQILNSARGGPPPSLLNEFQNIPKQDQITIMIKALRYNNLRVATVSRAITHFTREQLVAFAEALEVSTTLLTLDFSDVTLSEEDVLSLSRALKSTQITSVTFAKCNLQPAGLISLSKEWFSATNCTLTSLVISLEPSVFNEKSSNAFGGAISTNKSISTVNLSSCAIGSNRTVVKDITDGLKNNKGITTLNLASNTLDDESAELLADALITNNTLTTLNLLDNKIKPTGVAKLADAIKHNSKLSSLILSKNPLKDKGASYLGEALKVNKSLTDLSLVGAEITGDGVACIATSSTLISLNIWGNLLGPKGSIALADCLKNNHTLTSICIKGVNLSSGASAFKELLCNNTSLLHIDLSGNSLEIEGAREIAKGIEVNSTLQVLRLGGNSLGNRGAVSLAEAISKNNECHLQELDLQLNVIADEAMAELCKALAASKTIRTIGLSYNHLGITGLKKLAGLLQTSKLITSLNLEGNQCGWEGMMFLGEALAHNRTLRSLNIAHNNLRAEGGSTVAQIIKSNSSLTDINLKRNNLSDEGATAIAEALKRNASLLQLNLEDNRIEDAGATQIADTLAINATLAQIDLANNIFTENGFSLIQTAVARNGKVRMFH